MRRSTRSWLLALTLVPALLITDVRVMVALDQYASESVTLPVAESSELKLSADGRSRLYPENWYPGYEDAEGRFLHDYSFTGYHRGEKDIPEVSIHEGIDITKAPYFADNTGMVNATYAIQSAINDVASQGGGTVYLPEGTYHVKPPEGQDYSLHIPASNIVLKGAGMNKTYIYNAAENMKSKDIIRVGNGDWKKTQVSTQLRNSVSEPTVSLPVQDVSGFEINDYILITFETTQDFLTELGMQNKWASRLGKIEPLFYRQIVDVDKVGKTITLDIPTRYPLKLRDQVMITKTEDPISEIGIEDFSIANVQNSKDGLGENDFKVKGTAAYESDNAKVINVVGIANSWIRNISTYKPYRNAEFHILSKGIILDRTKNVTVDHVTMQYPQYRGANGNGYLYQFIGNDNLIENSSAIGARHSFTYANFSANGNVLHNNYSENPTLLTDFHMYLSMANLIDNMVVNGDGISAITRDYGSSETNRHGVVTTESVFWNTTGQAAHKSKKGIIIESEQFGNGYIIGTKGKASGVNVNIDGSITDTDTKPYDMAEGIGEGGRLVPQSLYADQKEKRNSNINLGLKSLRVNDEGISGMQFLKTEYTYILPYATKDVPVIAAETLSSDANITITQPTSVSGMGSITVEFHGVDQEYHIQFEVAKTPILPKNISIAPNKSVPGWRASGNAISAGNSGELTAYLTLDNGDVIKASDHHIPVTFTVDNEEIGTVSENKLTAIKAGTIQITAKCVIDEVSVEVTRTVEVKEPMEAPEGTFATIKKVTASADDGNLPKHAADKDPDSRWSADGINPFLQFELDKEEQISKISIQFYNGSSRSNYFDLEVSTDGVTYHKVLDHMTSQKQEQAETFEFPMTSARYVRFIGRGNESNAWNSIVEFWVHLK